MEQVSEKYASRNIKYFLMESLACRYLAVVFPVLKTDLAVVYKVMQLVKSW